MRVGGEGGVGLFQISKKERLFHLLREPSALLGNLTMQRIVNILLMININPLCKR